MFRCSDKLSHRNNVVFVYGFSTVYINEVCLQTLSFLTLLFSLKVHNLVQLIVTQLRPLVEKAPYKVKLR